MNDMLALESETGLALYVTSYVTVTKNLTYMRVLPLLRTALIQLRRHISVRSLSLTSPTFWNRKKFICGLVRSSDCNIHTLKWSK